MKPSRKLRLHRESLHELTNEDLAMVVGGADVVSLTTCDPQCITYTETQGCPSDDTRCPTDFCTDTCTYRDLCPCDWTV